jgi:GntR family transcriptional regulator/MocR family aminotransferase
MREPLTTHRSSPIGRRLADAVDVHVGLAGPFGRGDVSGQIYRQLRGAVREGRLRPGDRLPPTRELARRLGVSRTTTSVAYDRLISEGFAFARIGSGTFVSDVAVASTARRAPVAVIRPLPAWEGIRLPSYLWPPADYDFRPGVPDVNLFPFRTWRRLMGRQFQPSVVGRGVNGHPAGEESLRAAIAHHVGLARGIRATAENIVVTNGTQQAIDLIGRTLLRSGDQVAVEDPGYGPPVRLLSSMGARVRSVPVDNEGLVVDEIPPGTRLVYVTPAHQLPLGMTMSPSRRVALLAWAARHDGVIIEDDYDSEFRFGGRPVEPLHLLDESGRVVYVASFSKTTLPTLRLGFIVAPPSLWPALHAAKFLTDWHSAVPLQGAMAEFIVEGHFARHVRRMRLVYEARHRLIRDVLTDRFSSELRVIPSAAGLHISAAAPGLSVDEIEAIVRRASQLGVECHPLALFALAQPPLPGLVLGYGAITVDRIEAGLGRLHRAMFRESGRSSTPDSARQRG